MADIFDKKLILIADVYINCQGAEKITVAFESCATYKEWKKCTSKPIFKIGNFTANLFGITWLNTNLFSFIEITLLFYKSNFEILIQLMCI